MRLSVFNLLNPLILCGLLLVFGIYHIHQQHNANQRRAQSFAREYELSQRRMLSFVVSSALDFARFKQSQIEQRIQAELKARVYEAFFLAERLYAASPVASGAELQRQILSALGSMSFNGGRGYYFVYTLEGRVLLSADRARPAEPAFQPPPGADAVVAELARIVRRQGEGYYSYDWRKPGGGSEPRAKISFVMGFRPFGWLIGAGEYVEDMQAQVQREVIDWIQHMRFADQGYLWIHDTDLRMIVHPYFPRESNPAWYTKGGLKDYVDPNGKHLFAEMAEVCRQNGCGYVRYLWNKPENSALFEKLSFVELIPEWSWIVGAGIYLDDLQRTIRQNERHIDREFRRQLWWLGALVGVLLSISLALTRFFHGQVGRAFALFSRHFRNAARAKEKIEPASLRFTEFKRLAGYVNQMVEAQQAADAELRENEKRLLQSQKMEAVGQLAGGIAHDFGNLIMAIHGYAELLAWGEELAPEARSGLQEILKTSEKAGALTHQLLAFSRQQVRQPTLIDLNRVLADLGDMLRRIIGENIRLSTELAAELGLIVADPTQIEQIAVNLALNARDAMPGGGCLRITTSNCDLQEAPPGGDPCMAPARYVLLEFSDDGQGMDAHTQEHAFEPFFTTKPAGKGTGLGLATVYGIVKQSGGYVWVYSEPGRGATFKTYLPRSQAEPQAEADGEAPRPQATGRGETILLVEDEEVVREAIARTLEKLGYSVLVAGGGREALDILQGCGRVDLLLLDLIMPELGGVKLAERIPAPHRDKPILFMTGYPACEEVGSRPFIQKPFTTPELQARLSELLR
jgi:signal transduction histidine kinase